MPAVLPPVILVAVFTVLTAIAEETVDPAGHVSRALFTTAIHENEPADNLLELNSATEQVFFFTESRNMTSRVLTHSWEYQGEVIEQIPVRIGGPCWRSWTSKVLTPDMRGTWAVVVFDESGAILAEKMLDYNPEEPSF